jgi:hypothetical protein
VILVPVGHVGQILLAARRNLVADVPVKEGVRDEVERQQENDDRDEPGKDFDE